MKKRWLIAVAALLLAVLGTGTWFATTPPGGGPDVGETVEIVVPPGAGALAIGEQLRAAGLINGSYDAVKVLGNGDLERKLTVAVDAVSASAKTKIEQELYLIMLEYRQRTFQGAFHVSNDYMHWYGWAPLNTAVNNIKEEAKRMRAEHKK